MDNQTPDNTENPEPPKQPEHSDFSPPKHIEHGHKLIYGYVLFLILAAIAGYCGYIYHKDHNVTKPVVINKTSKKTSLDTPSTKLLTYDNSQAGLTFKYPSNWTSQVMPNSYYTTGNTFAAVSGTITSPIGNKLTWIYQVDGGKGDAGCTPDVGNTPFAAGDKCASKQIISVEQISSVNATTNSSFRNLFGDSLYITESKFNPGSSDINPVTGKSDNSTTYQICLDPYYNGNDGFPLAPPKLSTAMGFELPCEYWDTGFNVSFQVADEAGFNSQDAKTAIQIMKSFNSYTAPRQYLDIKEWGVKIALSAPIANATYEISSYGSAAGNLFLSTKTLNAYPACMEQNSPSGTSGTGVLSDQDIARTAATATVYPSDAPPGMTAAQAAVQYPSQYRQVDDYVYSFSRSGGLCSEETPAIQNAFAASFTTIQAD